ncbi:MAG TPA: alpha/beta fold hydrolase [Pseudobdellovibrionaceae bacterium]|nr:alpha/beta fold hydrolase [Pseudobdellovibrionaceae bacterium]
MKDHQRFFVHHHHRLAYKDEGKGDVIIFVHGTPSSSDEFSQIIQSLKSEYRCISLDLLGFGNSDKPLDADYSLNAHRQRLSALIRFLELKKYHLALTDFGGPIALPLAIENWDRVQSLILFNTWAWPLTETQPQLIKLRSFMLSRLMKYLYLNWNFSAKVLMKKAWGTYRRLSKARHQHYQKYLHKKTDRNGTWSFVTSLFSEDEVAWKAGQTLARMQGKPVQIFWGMSDPMIKPVNLKKWKEIFPQAKIESFSHVGHFVAEEAAELVHPQMKTFLKSTNEKHPL